MDDQKWTLTKSLTSFIFEDLKPEKQQEILDEVGIEKPEDMNWDFFPLFNLNLDYPKG